MSGERRHSYRRSVLVWCALMALLLLSFGSAWLKLGAWNSVLNLAIAVVKAMLVAVFFMHLRHAPALLRIVAATALLMLALLFGLTRTDYATRAMHPAPLQNAAPTQHPGG